MYFLGLTVQGLGLGSGFRSDSWFTASGLGSTGLGCRVGALGLAEGFHEVGPGPGDLGLASLKPFLCKSLNPKP